MTAPNSDVGKEDAVQEYQKTVLINILLTGLVFLSSIAVFFGQGKVAGYTVIFLILWVIYDSVALIRSNGPTEEDMQLTHLQRVARCGRSHLRTQMGQLILKPKIAPKNS